MTATRTTSDESTLRPAPIAPGFDLPRLRCAPEVKLRAFIDKNDKFFQRLMDCAPERQEALVDGRLSLIKDTYRVDPLITPMLDELRNRIRVTLRLVRPIDMYVQANPMPNAFCIPSRKGTRLIMCLNSALLDLLTPDELLFVMGHEIGHALFDHARIPKIGYEDPRFSPLEVLWITKLGRRQELSCDRVGIVACQSVHAAGSALLKIMSGISDKWLTFDAAAFASHFDRIAELAEVKSVDDGASTHPLIGVRVKALLAFAESQLYAEATGAAMSAVPTDEMERTTDNLLKTVEPDVENLETASEQDSVNRFLVSGAMAMVVADGAIDRKEMAYLRAHVKVTDDMVAAMNRPDFVKTTIEALGKDAWILSRKLSMTGRASLLHELCNIALAAGGYAEDEVGVLATLGQMLELPEEAFRNVLGEAQAAAPKPGRQPRKPKTVEA